MSATELTVKNGLYDLLIVVRDENGRFAYRATMLQSVQQVSSLRVQKEDKSEEASPSQHDENEAKDKLPERPQPLIDARGIADISLASEKEMQTNVETFLRDETKREEEWIHDIAQKSTPASEKLDMGYRNAQVNSADSTLARLFFQHFQLIQGRRFAQACTLQNNEELIADLRAVDDKPVRNLQIVPVLYYKSPSAAMYESNCSSSPTDIAFDSFLSSLGMRLNSPSRMKTGNFDRFRSLADAFGAVYSPGAFCDQLFLVPSEKQADPSVSSLREPG